MKTLNKEYEEISEEQKEELEENEYCIFVDEKNKTRYFREVKPASEFPIKIELDGIDFYLEVIGIGDRKSINLFHKENNIVLVADKSYNQSKDINGVLKALLYLETEDDIIKRLKELR